MSARCPKRSVSFLQSGRPAKPRICAMKFYEAVVGELTLPARSGRSLLHFIPARFLVLTEHAVSHTAVGYHKGS